MNNWLVVTDSPILLTVGGILAINGSVTLLVAWGAFGSPNRVTWLRVYRLVSSGICRWTNNLQVIGYLFLAAPFGHKSTGPTAKDSVEKLRTQHKTAAVIQP